MKEAQIKVLEEKETNIIVDQWENGKYIEVNINKNKSSNHSMLYREPVYEDKWFPADINFTSFMDWTIKQILL